MKILIFLLQAMSLFLFFAANAHASFSSSFTSGDEGWRAIDPTGDYTSSWQASGGNPGGYLRGSETNSIGGDGYFYAPNSWLGNLSQFLGGTLSYDLIVFSGTSIFHDPDIIIESGNSNVSWSSTINPVGQGWVNFKVTLDSTNFGADIASVLSNVTAIRIRGEWITGPEQEGFDNVNLVSSAVPLPSAIWLFSPVLAYFGVFGRRIPA